MEGTLVHWSALRLNSKLKVEMTAMRDGWTDHPTRPGKEAGTEADVQKQTARLPSGIEIKAWPQAGAS